MDLLRAEVHKMQHTFQELLLKLKIETLDARKIQAIICNTKYLQMMQNLFSQQSAATGLNHKLEQISQ